MMGKHNNSTIGPEAFATVCVRHGLLKLVSTQRKSRLRVENIIFPFLSWLAFMTIILSAIFHDDIKMMTSLSLSLSSSPSLFFSLFLYHSLPLPLSPSPSLFFYLSVTLFLSLFFSHSLCLSLSLFLSLSFSFSLLGGYVSFTEFFFVRSVQFSNTKECDSFNR